MIYCLELGDNKATIVKEGQPFSLNCTSDTGEFLKVGWFREGEIVGDDLTYTKQSAGK